MSESDDYQAVLEQETDLRLAAEERLRKAEVKIARVRALLNCRCLGCAARTPVTHGPCAVTPRNLRAALADAETTTA